MNINNFYNEAKFTNNSLSILRLGMMKFVHVNMKIRMERLVIPVSFSSLISL